MKKIREGESSKPSSKELQKLDKRSMRKLIESKMDKMNPEEIIEKAGLDDLEVRLIQEYVFSNQDKGIGDIAKETGADCKTVKETMKKGIRKIQGKRARKNKGSARIKKIIEERMQNGSRLEEIMQQSNLSRMDRKVLEEYVLGQSKTFEEYAESLGVGNALVLKSLKRMEKKLGKPADIPGKMGEYLRMSDDEIREKMKGLNVQTRSEAWKKNFELTGIANERGILDQVYPKLIIQKLRSAILFLPVLEIDFRVVLEDFGAMEMELIRKMALTDRPCSAEEFADQHSISLEETRNLIRDMTRFLKPGRRFSSEIFKLNRDIAEWDDLEEFKQGLKDMELATLEGRILLKNPLEKRLLSEIGEEFGTSKERIRQIEKKLIDRLKKRNEEYTLANKKKGIDKTVSSILKKGDFELVRETLGITLLEEEIIIKNIMGRISISEFSRRTGAREETIEEVIDDIFEKCKDIQNS